MGALALPSGPLGGEVPALRTAVPLPGQARERRSAHATRLVRPLPLGGEASGQFANLLAHSHSIACHRMRCHLLIVRRFWCSKPIDNVIESDDNDSAGRWAPEHEEAPELVSAARGPEE